MQQTAFSVEQVDSSIKYWAEDFQDLSRLTTRFSNIAATELRSFVIQYSAVTDPESVHIEPDDFPATRYEIENFKSRLDGEQSVCIIQPEEPFGAYETQLRHWVVANLLGETLVQNSEGNRLIHMWDRFPTNQMSEAVRYHQTRTGGGFHTDNVNIPTPWQYLTMGCLVPAVVGGWSQFVSGLDVHRYLSLHQPEALSVLKEDFWWEYRGISEQLYQAPILTIDDQGTPHFRYLRAYLESAHRRAEQPLSDRQWWAINMLDAVLNLPELQLTYKLTSGEIALINDAQIFHARTHFVDSQNAISLEDCLAGQSGPVRRSIDRTWVKVRD